MSEQLVIYGGAEIVGAIEFSSASLTSQIYAYGVSYDPTTGQLAYMSTASFGSGSGGAGSPGGSSTQIQYNDGGAFNGVPTLTYSGGTLRGTGSFTGSFVGNLTGTASYANNADSLDGIDSTRFATTGSNTFRGDQTISGSLTLTASLSVFGGEFNVNSTGVKIGNTIGDVHTLTGSLNVSGSITASLFGTASYANNADLLDGIDSTRFATTGSNTFRGNQTITGSLDISGSISTRLFTASAAYTASIADSTIDLTGNVTASLYSVVGNTGRQLVIKNGGTGVVTVDAHTTETIDGQLTRRLAARESLLLQSDGVSDWLILNKTPVVMLFYHDSSGISLAANTTYYIGQLEGADPTTTSTLVTRRAIALTSGWITRITRMCSVAGTLSGTEDSTLQIRNVTTNTTVTVSSTIEFNVAAQLEDFTLATPLQVTRGDVLTMILTTGNWLTSPNSVRQTFNVLIE